LGPGFNTSFCSNLKLILAVKKRGRLTHVQKENNRK
jgi:hypothetical protein